MAGRVTPGDDSDASRVERRRDVQHARTPRPRIADLSDRPVIAQRAVSEAEVSMSQETLSRIIDGGVPRGDVLSVAELAGVMAGKRTSELVPLAHPVSLTDLVVQATPDRAASAVRIRAEAAATGQAGVEMQSLIAASVAALTVYDMVRDIEREAFLRAARLVSTTLPQGGEWQRREDLERRVPERASRAAGRAPQQSRGKRPSGSPARRVEHRNG